MNTKPFFQFNGTTDTEINKVPINGQVYIADSDDSGTPKLVTKISMGSLTSTSTIADFLADTNLWKVLSQSGESELEKITEDGNSGWTLLNDDRTTKVDIGNKAIDFTTYIPSSYNTSFKPGASGEYSVAIGTNTKATGYASFAGGNSYYSTGTIASGSNSFSFGYETTASGNSSHAIGEQTTASGFTAHAEGRLTTASGRHSHAEGAFTHATHDSAHAEGYRVTASGKYSHAEGYRSKAIGEHSHAEGNYTVAVSGSQQTIADKDDTNKTITIQDATKFSTFTQITIYHGTEFLNYSITNIDSNNNIKFFQIQLRVPMLRGGIIIQMEILSTKLE